MIILIVEDDASNASAISRVFKKEGHKTFIASSLKSSSIILKRYDIEAIILDLGLEDSRGLNTLIKIRELVNSSVPIVVFSGDAFMDIDSIIDAGGDNFLVKGDFIPRDLPMALEHAFTNRKLSLSLDEHKRIMDPEYKINPIYALTIDVDRISDNMIALSRDLKLLLNDG